MSRRGPRLAGLTLALLGSSGCTALLLGAGAAGGYAASRDSIAHYFDLPKSRVYDVSRSVVREIGFITAEQEARGLLKGEVAPTSGNVAEW